MHPLDPFDGPRAGGFEPLRFILPRALARVTQRAEAARARTHPVREPEVSQLQLPLERTARDPRPRPRAGAAA